MRVKRNAVKIVFRGAARKDKSLPTQGGKLDEPTGNLCKLASSPIRFTAILEGYASGSGLPDGVICFAVHCEPVAAAGRYN